MDTVLGISLGTRYVGLALLRNGHLIDCRVKPFIDAWSKEKENAILSFLEQYLITNGIKTIALKVTDPIRSSPQLIGMEKAFVRTLTEYSIEIYDYTIADIKTLCQNSRNKNQLSYYLASLYPYLYTAIDKERSRKKDYYTRMFEAVAVAHLTFRNH